MRAWTGLSSRRRLLYGVVAALVVALAVVLGVRALAGPDRSGTPAQDRPGPVLLVPGYGGNRDSLGALAGRVRATGREALVLTLPGNGTGDLLAQVAVLDREVDAALAAGAPSVDVIGYSAGGVVARLWVARNAGEHRARRVVTLGAPLHGTRLAATGGVVVPDACPTACQQLAPGSALLNSVAGAPVPLPWLSIWTENDQTVTPPDSARLDGATNVALQQLCPEVRTGHSELPTDRLVTALVLRAVGTAPLTARVPDTGC
ncbi:MAG TPA: lipase [Actinophytocola sp.]|uniref:esterase/lipase family protein n=1 Tax=Actinophytocola sp. TaxID=1872138 RepID=UPI002DB59B8B|nr:lipase [Actinophytocola sp.]HEU5473836.1 lipase [Actinophytocola sp.]